MCQTECIFNFLLILRRYTHTTETFFIISMDKQYATSGTVPYSCENHLN